MGGTEGYDVLRLIEHNKSCYVSSEYVEGTMLIRWLKYHPNLSKEQLFLWIHEMARQLECIHKCRGNPCYRYVNPYSIIITGKKELYFLDMSAKSNEKVYPVMRRRSVREHFFPPEEYCGPSENVFLDLYGLGKTVQYILSMSEPEPKLTKRETARFQKIISKCLNRQSKRAYTEMSEFRKQIPQYVVQENRFQKMRVSLLLLLALTSASAAGIIVYQDISKESDKDTELLAETRVQSEFQEIQEMEEQDIQNEKIIADLKKELGFLYFLDKRDYETSRKYFAEIEQDEMAERLSRLSEYMLMQDISDHTEELKELLEEIDKGTPEDEWEKYYQCMIEGYCLLDNEEASRAVLRLSGRWDDEADEEIQRKLAGYAASAYEKIGEYEKAIEKYMDMLNWKEADYFREGVYKKLIFLQKEAGALDKAESICRQGVQEMADSQELRLIHIELLCADTEIEREECVQIIKKYIEEMPAILKKQEFRKLKSKYGIMVEGEDVWVER